MAEWPCCHDPLRSSPTSHGFVPPHLHATLLVGAGPQGGFPICGTASAHGQGHVGLVLSAAVMCVCVWMHACVQVVSMGSALLTCTQDFKPSIHFHAQQVRYNSRSLMTPLLLVSLNIMHVLVSVGKRSSIFHVQQVRYIIHVAL